LARIVSGPCAAGVGMNERYRMSGGRRIAVRLVAIEAILPELITERRLGSRFGGRQSHDRHWRLFPLQVLRGLAGGLGEIHGLRLVTDPHEDDTRSCADPAQRQRAAGFPFEAFG